MDDNNNNTRITIFIDLKYFILRKAFPTPHDYIKTICLEFFKEICMQLQWDIQTDDLNILNKLIKDSYDEMKKRINFSVYNLTIMIKLCLDKAFDIFSKFRNKYVENKERIYSIIDNMYNNGSYSKYYKIKPTFPIHIREALAKGYKIINYFITYRTYKHALLRKVFGTTPELSSIHVMCLNNPTELNNLISIDTRSKRNIILTYRPFELPKLQIKTEFVYICSEKVNIAKKAKIEEKINQYPIIFEVTGISQLLPAIEFVEEQENSPNHNYLEVGYWVTTKKFDSIQRLHYCFNSKYPIKYIPIDLRFPLKRNIQAFIHKITDAVKKLEDPYNYLRLQNFHLLESKNNDIVFFDSGDMLEFATKRYIAHEKLTQILNAKKFVDELDAYFQNNPSVKKFKVKLPEHVLIDPTKDSYSLDNYCSLVHKLSYPIIVKTNVTCHFETGHFMGVAADEEGFKVIENHEVFRNEEHIVQQVIDHEERLIKAYVLGGKLFILQKQSLPAKNKEGYGATHFFFESQKPFSECEILKNKLTFKEIPEMINTAVILLISKSIKEITKMTIYGINLIREKNTGDYVILGIKFFPDFKGVANFDKLLKDHLWNYYHEVKELQIRKQSSFYD